MLYDLAGKIWETETIPEEWKEGFIVKIPKKGDLGDCNNYRGIMLLSTPGKVINRVMLERMREGVDRVLRDQQAGFRQERSCTDQIQTLRIILEQSMEWNSSTYINFIDFEKAFDSLDREALWELMRHYGIPEKFISLIKNTYDGNKGEVLHGGRLSQPFEIGTGVRQGCLLSPFNFLLAIDWILKQITEGKRNGIQWTLWKQLDDLDFADDIALLAYRHEYMQEKNNFARKDSCRNWTDSQPRKVKMHADTQSNKPTNHAKTEEPSKMWQLLHTLEARWASREELRRTSKQE